MRCGTEKRENTKDAIDSFGKRGFEKRQGFTFGAKGRCHFKSRYLDLCVGIGVDRVGWSGLEGAKLVFGKRGELILLVFFRGELSGRERREL